ncbi:MAG TPA: histidine kinase [Terriglobales bacterium]|jgi:signal transduction histidine kinase
MLRHRFLWRLRAPVSIDETRRVERWLASARVLLAISAFVAIWMDPGEIRYSPWASGLLGFYLAQGMIIIILLRRRRQPPTRAFRLLVHAADVIWPGVISVFATGQASPFFLFFIFVLAAAAYRWGLWETMSTAGASVILLWVESFIFHLGFLHWFNYFVTHHHLPLLGADVSDFEPKRLFMRSIYLIVMGLLLGALAEQQKQLRAEKSVIARILAGVRVESGMAGTLQRILAELLQMYDASSALIASQEAASNRVYVSEVRWNEGAATDFQWLDSSPADYETYLSRFPADTWFGFFRGGAGKSQMSLTGLDREGARIKDMPDGFLEQFKGRHQFKSVAVVSFLFGREWWGRIFLLNAELAGNTEEELRFLQEIVRQVGPAVYNVYLLRRLRQKAGAIERAKFARELHDGAVQSLIAVEMQVDVLRRQAVAKPAVIPEELGRIQSLLREEVLKLRELMQQMKSLDVDSKRLVPFLSDAVERFQRETGIVARFHCEVGLIDMPQQVCREVAHIVQEALVNVRKHSQAERVVVKLAADRGTWKLTVEDDGRGFPFTGTLTDAELETAGRGPIVIRERVHLIDGALIIESTPGRGARLEIRIPQRREAAYG